MMLESAEIEDPRLIRHENIFVVFQRMPSSYINATDTWTDG